MAMTPSTMLALGTVAVEFNLPEPMTGDQKALHDIKGDTATVVMFICNHCPFVKLIQGGLTNIANDYDGKDISFVAISANDADDYPEDSPEKMVEIAKSFGYPFPYLYDEDQHTAKSYQAACTPDFFVFDKDLKLVYRGQFDSARPGNGVPVSGEDIRNTLDNILAEKSIDPNQHPSVGCNIKWKPSHHA